MDFGAAFPARAELLHGLTRSGSAATCYLYRLADASNMGRHRGGNIVRPAVAVDSDRSVVDVYRVW